MVSIVDAMFYRGIVWKSFYWSKHFCPNLCMQYIKKDVQCAANLIYCDALKQDDISKLVVEDTKKLVKQNVIKSHAP